MLNKLFTLREELLLEAIDLSSSKTIIRAIERGQVSGVKKSLIAGGNKDYMDGVLSDLSSGLSKLVSTDKYNRYITHILSHVDSMFELGATIPYLEDIVESLNTYYNNVNKKEVKEIPEIANKFNEFISLPIRELRSSLVRKEFDDFVQIKLAHKVKMTDEDVTVVYKKDGWEVVVPKTFSAAKRYACMNNRKATWCTSASLDSWGIYNNRKIYIIRNEKEDKMYQMDFGKKGEMMGTPSFNDGRNLKIKIDKVKEEIPEHVLKSIKREDGKTLHQLLFGDATEDRDEELTTDSNLSNREIVPFKTLKELQKELSKFGYKVSFEYINNLDEEYASDRLNSRQKDVGEIRASGKYVDGKNTFIYIIPKKRTTLTFTLEDPNGKKREFGGATIFKVEKNKLIPFSLKNFLQYPLPEKLARLLNDTNRVRSTQLSSDEKDISREVVDLRGEIRKARDKNILKDLMGNDRTEEDERKIQDAIDEKNKRIDKADEKILLYNKNGLKVFKVASKLSSYLTVPGISNKELLQIKSLVYNRGVKPSLGNNLFFIYNKGVYLIDKSNPFVGMPKFRVEKINKEADTAIDRKALGTEGGPEATYPFRFFPSSVKSAFYSFLMSSPDTTFFPESLRPIREKNEDIYNRIVQWVLKGDKKDTEPIILKDYGNGLALYLNPKERSHKSVFFSLKGNIMYNYSYREIVSMKKRRKQSGDFLSLISGFTDEQMNQIEKDFEAGHRTIRFFLG